MPEPANLTTVTQKRFCCRHVHSDGRQCGSPALRGENFCYFHHTTRRPKPPAGKFRHLDAAEPFELPIVEDLPSALSVAAQLLCRIASNDLDPTRAGKLLYNLQILTSLIAKTTDAAAKAESGPKPALVEELVPDETHGPIAPITELPPQLGAPHLGVPGQLAGGGERLASEMWDRTTPSSKRDRTTSPSVTAPQPATGNLQPATPPPLPERPYTQQERDHFHYTVFARGYEPNPKYPRPASITDEDIQAHAAAHRRPFHLSPLTPRKDDAGRLLSLHELGPRYTIPTPIASSLRTHV
jgi:hypothetical protein